MNEIIKGKPVADALSLNLQSEVEKLQAKGIYPQLTIVRVGANPSDLAYERGALKRMESIGIKAEVLALPESIPQEGLIQHIRELNENTSVHGIMLFRPLPPSFDEDVLKYVIAPEKDVDCFSPINVAKIFEGDETGLAPCTPTAVMETLKHYAVPLQGKKVVVLGRSMVVGKPVAMMLLKENATVTICHSKTRDLPAVAAQADVLVAAIGRAKMVTPEYIKEGAVVMDVGINVDENGNLCGDVDTEKCLAKASMITPVPGGIGTVTSTVLAKNVIQACQQQQNPS